jgi:hypothetical protein
LVDLFEASEVLNKLKKKQEDLVRFGICNYICWYINAVAKKIYITVICMA